MKITIQDARTSVTLQQRDFRVTISGARGPAGPQGEAGASEWGDIGGTLSNQTDLQTALNAKVPYTGATQDVNLGEYGAQIGNLEFDNTPTNVPTTAGSVYWNDTDGTLNLVLKGGQVISRIGETQHIRALNNTGAQIARGKVVYVVGAQGQRLTIALADADTEILSKDTIGFTAEAIADGAEGFVIVQGVINNVSTTGMTDGATVYLSQTAGGYTTTAPTDPAHLVVLGFIVNGGSGGAGSIYVKVDNGYELEELHGVADAAKVTPVGADALLLRDSEDNNLWKRLTWTNALAGVKSHMDTFKSVAGGYASLDGSGKVPSSELPSYVDDVVEVANYAALPGTGETGKIYVTLDTNKCYRWSGSVYVQVAQGIDTLTTTGTSGAATLVGSTLNIPQYQGVLTNPVTGTGTAGQVAYFNGTSAVTGSANLFWDAVNNRLGIGTASPAKLLSINGEAEATIIRGGTVYFRTGTDTNFYIKWDTGDFLTYRSFANHRWQTYNTINSVYETKMQIFASGNILVQNGGTFTDTNARLTVRGSGTTSATTALLVQNSTPTELFKVTDDGSANFGTGMFWDNANGRLGIGTASPSSKLHIVDTLTTTADLYTSVNISGTITSRNTAGDTIYGLRSNQNLVSTATNQKIIGADLNFGTTFFNSTTELIGLKVSGFANTQDAGTAFWAVQKSTAGDNGILIQPNNNRWAIGRSTGQTTTISGARVIYASNGIYVSNDSNTPTAMLHVRGSGTTSATTALLVQNSGANELIKVRDDGFIQLGSNSNLGIVVNNNGTNTPLPTGVSVRLNHLMTTEAQSGFVFKSYFDSLTATSGTQTNATFSQSFRPTSGTAQFNQVTINFTVDQTGGANGITRGLYIQPNILSAADYRSIETSNNTGYAAFFGGSADLFLGNGADIQIGTTTGTKIGTATSQKIGLWNATPIVQPTTAVAAATRVGGGGTTVTDTDTFDGYTIAQLVKALRNMGALA